MLLIIEVALLLILADLGQVSLGSSMNITDMNTDDWSLWLLLLQDQRAAAAEEDIYPLDMAPNSVDDQYEGCREDMTNDVETKYLKKELNNSDTFKIAWKKAEEFAKKNDTDLKKNHLMAMYVYSGSHVFNHFNNDTRYGKEQYRETRYKWYSLYFLLTEAIQILNKTQNTCYSTFRRTKVKFNENVLNHEVRFGQFASSSLNINKTTFGNVSCFEINTCEGADVSKYSKLSEKEVLIPPYEKFKVTDIKKKGQEGAWCDTVFILESTGRKSDLNCALYKKKTKSIKRD